MYNQGPKLINDGEVIKSCAYKYENSKISLMFELPFAPDQTETEREREGTAADLQLALSRK